MRKDLKAQKEEVTAEVCSISSSSNKMGKKKSSILAYNLKSVPVTILMN